MTPVMFCLEFFPIFIRRKSNSICVISNLIDVISNEVHFVNQLLCLVSIVVYEADLLTAQKRSKVCSTLPQSVFGLADLTCNLQNVQSRTPKTS